MGAHERQSGEQGSGRHGEAVADLDSEDTGLLDLQDGRLLQADVSDPEDVRQVETISHGDNKCWSSLETVGRDHGQACDGSRRASEEEEERAVEGEAPVQIGTCVQMAGPLEDVAEAVDDLGPQCGQGEVKAAAGYVELGDHAHAEEGQEVVEDHLGDVEVVRQLRDVDDGP